MKKLIQVSFLLCLSFLVMATKPNQENNGTQLQNHYAIQTPGFNSSLSYDGDALLKVSCVNLNGQPIKFQLLQDGTSLILAKYKDLLVNDGFNLAQLPAGIFTLRLVQGDQCIERNIQKKTQAIIFE